MAEHEPPIGMTSDWYTPPGYFTKLGLTFDLDPASPGRSSLRSPRSCRPHRRSAGTKLIANFSLAPFERPTSLLVGVRPKHMSPLERSESKKSVE